MKEKRLDYDPAQMSGFLFAKICVLLTKRCIINLKKIANLKDKIRFDFLILNI
jgi:hypothetical protein